MQATSNIASGSLNTNGSFDRNGSLNTNGSLGTNGRSGSRFMSDFSSGANAFQTGVDQNIWISGRNGRPLPSRRDPAGSASASQAQSGDTSPNRQRMSLAAGNFSPTIPINTLANGAAQLNSSNVPETGAAPPAFIGPGALDPSATVFSSRNSAESLQGLSNATSSRGSSQHGIGQGQQADSARNHRSSQSPIDQPAWSPRSRVNSTARFQYRSDNGVASRWDNLPEIGMYAYSHVNSQAVSQSNSQNVSRNNSVPPSRHGAESSPTELSFHGSSFSDFRAGPFTASERPTSRGLYATMPLGQIIPSAGRRLSIPPVVGATDDAPTLRAGSVASRATAIASVAPRNGDQLLGTGLSEGIREMNLDNTFPGLHGNPDQHLTMTYEMNNGFPVLNQVQRAPQNHGSIRGNNSAGYLDQMTRVRGNGSELPWEMLPHQDYGFNGSWQYQQQPALTQAQAQTQAQSQAHAHAHAGMGRNMLSYGMQADLQPELYDVHSAMDQQQVFSADHGGRYDTNSISSYRSLRGPAPNRHAFTAAIPNGERLLSGNNWTEKYKPNSNQKVIEVGPDCRLRDTIGYVVRFCGDQAGSRFIQDKLAEANSDDKEIIFQELLPNAIPLCIDPFGNYVIQKFFEHGTQGQKAQLAGQMRGKVRDLSMNMYGCRCIQKALDHVLVEQKADLVSELQPCLFEVSQDPQGNHVVQKAISGLRPEYIPFILHGYYDHVQEMSNHMYGCRVMQRLLEVEVDGVRRRLVDEILKSVLFLTRSNYGNYVVQHVIDGGNFEDRNRLIDIIHPLVIDLMGNKYASNVIEKCLEKGTAEQRTAMVAKLAEIDPSTGQPKHLRAAIQSNFGNYVVQRVLKVLTLDPWDRFASLVDREVQAINREQNTPDKKMLEIQKLLREPRDHRAPGCDNEVSSTNDRRPQISIASISHAPQATRNGRNGSGGRNSIRMHNLPPLPARVEDSAESSGTPSTSSSQESNTRTSIDSNPEP